MSRQNRGVPRVTLPNWLRGGSAILSVRLLSQALAALALFVVAPLLKPAGFSIYLILLQSGQVLAAFVTMGAEVSMVRQLSPVWGEADSSRAVLRHLGRLVALIALVVLSIATAILMGIGYFTAETWLYPHHVACSLALTVVLTTAMCSGAELFVSQTLLATGSLGLSAVTAGMVRNVAFLLLVLMMVWLSGANLSALLSAQIMASSAGLLFSCLMYGYVWKRARNEKTGEVQIQLESAAKTLSIGRQVVLSYLLVRGQSLLEVTAMRILFGGELAGIYGLAQRVVNFLGMLANAFGQTLGPLTARAKSAADKRRLEDAAAGISLLIVGATAALLLLVIIGRESLVSTIFGESYGLAWSYIAIFLVFSTLKYMFGMPIPILFVKGIVRPVTASYLVIGLMYLFSCLVAWGLGAPLLAAVGLGLSILWQGYYLWNELNRNSGIRCDVLSMRT